MTEKELVLSTLNPLIEKAEKEGMWLVSKYQSIWFSPKELREQNAKGSYLWGAVNWVLDDPIKELAYLEKKVIEAQRNVEDFKRRMK